MSSQRSIPGDDELLLFHFGEDLGPERMQSIALAIAEDPRCAARYAELKRLLAASTSALGAVAEPRPGFEQRAWRRLAPQLRPAQESRAWWRGGWGPPLALAASVGLGIALGRLWQAAPPASTSPAAVAQVVALEGDAGARLLAVRLAAHLGRTERLLRAADNGAEASEFAQTLIDSNRLYAAAAERAGKPTLAAFLTELEPVLRELANADADASLGGGELAREQIRSRDLLFRLRALQTLQSAPTQRL